MNKYIGLKFNLLTITEVDSIKKNGRSTLYASCECDCGKTYYGKLCNIRYGIKPSCGCEHSSKILNKKLYTRWKAMRSRCLNKNNNKYHRYGGRGISFCKEWNDYKTFESWALSNGYKHELSLDRIDNDGDYGPNNCRWVNQERQARNRSNTINITMNGETKCLSEWCNIRNLSYQAVRARVQDMGWSPVKAITTPIRKFNGTLRSN